VLHDLYGLKCMHVEVIELHDGVMIAECCLRDVVAFVALSFGVCFVIMSPLIHPFFRCQAQVSTGA
jgi:hypothetical protein